MELDQAFGAVSDTGETFFLPCEENFNSDTTIRLLDALQTEFGEKICVVLDNASYFTSNAVHEFVFIPPYSPTLNAIEPLWKDPKRDISPTIFEDKDHFREFLTDRFLRLSHRLSFANDWIETFLPEVQKLR